MDNFFSVEEFKKWMDNHNDPIPRFVRQDKNKKDFIGLSVESKINIHKLIENIEPTHGGLHSLAKDFRHNGGIIRGVENHNFIVEVDSGSFIVSRNFVSLA